jgi:hypothetical protein
MVTLATTGLQYSNDLQTSRAGLKSVQNLFVNPATSITGDFGSGTSVDITIAAVDTSKSFLIYGPVSACSDGYYSYFKTMVMKFTSSTTVQISTNTTLNPSYSIRFQVVEFY